MRWTQIRRKCYACSTPLGGFHTPVVPHTAADADAGGGGVMTTMVMRMVAIRRRSITLATQERCHRQLLVQLHIRSGSHIHG